MKFNLTSLILSLLLISSFSYGQNLKGRAVASYDLESGKAEAIKFGNVEAYDNKGKLVASVLTDDVGNYNISFKDTGTYQIKIMYAGYKEIEESIHVTKDEVGDFMMKRDHDKKVRNEPARLAMEPDSRGLIDAYYSDMSYSKREGGGELLPRLMAKSKLNNIGIGLTAGEINDFSKWDLWNDMVSKELEIHKKTWKLDPSQRYVVQLMNKEKSPLVGAEVSLISKSNIVLWKAITDNTGKAELWGSIRGVKQEIRNINIKHLGKTERINSPSQARDGINTLVIDAPCDDKNIVDVAFVVDATGSMSDEINFIKSDLNSVIYNSQNIYQDVALRYASVFYRDNGDTYLTKHKDFTNVLSEALVFIDEQSAGGGGDAPEAVEKGLEVAIDQLTWSSEARSKILFLILDAEAHSDSATVERIKELAEKAARNGIKIIPVAASGINKSGEYLMRALALCTNGTYIFLTDHSGIGNSHIEPTTDEYDVELLSDRLTSVIKNNMFYPACSETIPEFDLDYPDSLVQFPYVLLINPFPNDSLSIADSLSRIDSLNVNIDSLLIQDSLTVSRDSLHVENPVIPIEWKFYPNPTQDIVNIEASENVDMIYLTDLSGKLLQEISFQESKTQRISLGNYPSGIYLLRYPIGKQWVTGKIILTR